MFVVSIWCCFRLVLRGPGSILVGELSVGSHIPNRDEQHALTSLFSAEVTKRMTRRITIKMCSSRFMSTTTV